MPIRGDDGFADALVYTGSKWLIGYYRRSVDRTPGLMPRKKVSHFTREPSRAGGLPV